MDRVVSDDYGDVTALAVSPDGRFILMAIQGTTDAGAKLVGAAGEVGARVGRLAAAGRDAVGQARMSTEATAAKSTARKRGGIGMMRKIRRAETTASLGTKKGGRPETSALRRGRRAGA